MRKKLYFFLAALLVSVAVLLVLKQRGHNSTTPAVLETTPVRTLKDTRPAWPASGGLPPSTNASVQEIHTRAIERMQQWAAAAKLPTFDPTVIRYQDHSNRLDGRIVSVQISTPTHDVSFSPRADGEIIQAANSHYNAFRTTPEHEAKWYQATGTWTEKEAIAETRAILERLGASQTLTKIVRVVYEQPTLPVKAPDGQIVRLTPFANVQFYGAEDRLLVEAEYRMNASGPALVRWWHWP
jgi:hypothetical protein